ncbi:hypothetical protein OM076_07005 [Solirubrobacter ginsenosidimutans]|uniref:Uncharacterized protein n=1 Tax=Solirubrobacter ginsenosidimutans TaxID=490573 RepID=A0A9X3S3V9_9ACTN|nr:hypothetical protein [Solirubrobacter ginsenosidimutans]MDA0160003.1 hypothetical protein [Solirubrobacter ginsenosidimutans]
MARLPLLALAVALLAGCGTQEPVTKTIPGDFLGYKLVQLPRGYGVRCPAAMRARHSGSGDGASMVVNESGVQLVTAALQFSDAGGAQRAYAATISPQTRQCYADGFVAELVRKYGVHVRRVGTGPSKVASQVGDERSGTRVSVVVAGRRRDVTVSADTAAIRIGSELSLDQVIDLTALGSRVRAPDPRLAEAVS